MSLAVHVTGVPATHAPFWHVSACVQTLSSLHDAPSTFAGFEHIPVAGSHVPTSWHASLAVHVTVFAPVHTPFWHESCCVHALLSSHDVPFGLAGLEHIPVIGSQVPTSWQTSLAAHVTAVPLHTPFWHASACVQALSSLHDAPSALTGFEHPVRGSHVPMLWHVSLAVQVTAAPGTHTPA